MPSTPEKREEIREGLKKIKPKTYQDVSEDLSNLNKILDEYEQIATTARVLQPLDNQTLKEVFESHSMEYQVYRLCATRLKRINEQMETIVRSLRGKEYDSIRRTSSRADLSERAIQQLIDGNDLIRNRTAKLLRVKEVLDLFQGILDTYTVRGYQINNMTKLLDVLDIDSYVI